MGAPAPLVPPSLADALFTSVEQRVLALLFGQPDRSFQKSELVRLARSGTGAVYRLLDRLAERSLVTVTAVGNQKHYRANREAPIFPELHGLVVKTVALVEPLRTALEPLADRILVAFVYGSVARGTDTARSDIDLMIVAEESLGYADVLEITATLEAQLGRPVNPTMYSPEEWQKRIAGDGFAKRVLERPKLFVIGTADALP